MGKRSVLRGQLGQPQDAGGWRRCGRGRREGGVALDQRLYHLGLGLLGQLRPELDLSQELRQPLERRAPSIPEDPIHLLRLLNSSADYGADGLGCVILGVLAGEFSGVDCRHLSLRDGQAGRCFEPSPGRRGCVCHAGGRDADQAQHQGHADKIHVSSR